MNSPLETYNRQKNKDSLRRGAFDFFEQKYFRQPYMVQDDIFETNERILAQKLKFFIPGRIYTWSYDPIGKDFLDFYDKRPMVLVHSQFIAKTTGNMIVQGLNLNFLPELARVQTMNIFYDIFAADIQDATKQIENEQLGILRNAWKVLTNWYFTLKLFNQEGKIGYQWAYRNYIITKITQPVLIELEDWQMIPYFVPKEFMGKTPAQVWSEYLMAKPDLIKKQVNDVVSQKNQKKYINRN